MLETKSKLTEYNILLAEKGLHTRGSSSDMLLDCVRNQQKYGSSIFYWELTVKAKLQHQNPSPGSGQGGAAAGITSASISPRSISFSCIVASLD